MTTLQPVPSDAFSVMRTRGLEGLDAIAGEWRQLVKSASLEPFCGPDWMRTFVASHDKQSEFYLVTARYEGKLEAVLPLLLTRAWVRGVPARVLHGAVGLPTLRFDVAASSGPRQHDALGSLWRHLADWPAWTVFDLQPVPAGGRAEQLLAMAAQEGYPTWQTPALYRALYMDLAAGVNAVVAQVRPSFRTDLRRTRRRLEESGTVTFESLCQARREDLDEFFALEAAGWKGHTRAGKAILARRHQQYRFYHDLMAALVPQGQFVLHRLRLEQRTIAGAMGLWGPSSYHVLKLSYDENFARFGPGQLLIESIARECERLGVQRFDFYGEEYDYERKWTATGIDHHTLLIFRRNWRGRLLNQVKRQKVPAWLNRAQEAK